MNSSISSPGLPGPGLPASNTTRHSPSEFRRQIELNVPQVSTLSPSAFLETLMNGPRLNASLPSSRTSTICGRHLILGSPSVKNTDQPAAISSTPRSTLAPTNRASASMKLRNASKSSCSTELLKPISRQRTSSSISAIAVPAKRQVIMPISVFVMVRSLHGYLVLDCSLHPLRFLRPHPAAFCLGDVVWQADQEEVGIRGRIS